MSFVLCSPGQSWGADAIWSWLQTPVALPPRVAFQAVNSAPYVLQMLRAWHQGSLTLLLDPKLPVHAVNQLLQQEDILLSAAEDWACPPATVSLPASASGPSDPAALAPLDQAVSLIRTSGSSGTPKLAQHTWGNHVWSARGSQQYLPLGPEDAWLSSLPLFHVGGLAILVRCWLAGAQLQMPAPEQSLAEALVFFEPTHLSLVPTQLQRLLARPELLPYLQKCKAILLGGAPVSTALLQAAQQAKLSVHTSYGSTEMSSQIATTAPGFWLTAVVTDGPVASGELLPYRQLRLHEEEIQVRGETLFQGYRERGELRRPLQAGWWPTGDLGRWQDGQLYITGRKDNQFISGGENIQPEEIEAYLLRHPAVQQAMVVSVLDADYGERPVALIELKDTQRGGLCWNAFTQTLGLSLEQYLPRFKIPMAFYPWPTALQGHKLKPGRRDFTAYARQLWQDQTHIDTL